MYTMEHYSAMKKKEILLFATTWMDLEGIKLSEISQTKTNTVWSHLHVESKKHPQTQLREQTGGHQRWEGGWNGWRETKGKNFQI